MTHYKYLIVGGGMTADAAARGIREVDTGGSIGLYSTESDPPYNRPPLSKGLWKGKRPETIWRGTDKLGIELRLGRTVRVLDPRVRSVTDDRGEVATYERLLLATGGTPRRLPYGGDRIVYFRTFRDYEKLRGLMGQGKCLAVIGGGFIGSEIAAALAMNQQRVVMIMPEETIGARVFPRDLGLHLNDYYREKGVELYEETSVVGLEPRGERSVLKLRGVRSGEEEELEADAVVAGIGITPGIELAQAAGLKVDGGIVVDEMLRTSQPDVFAAGDVAVFPSHALGRHLRVEHEDNANTMGRQAGRNMAGAAEPYRHLPFFYSDLFDLGYEAVGDTDARLQTVTDWQEPNRKGVIYYLGDKRVRGVLLWNVWEQVAAARSLIAEPGPFTAETVKGRLPELARQG